MAVSQIEGSARILNSDAPEGEEEIGELIGWRGSRARRLSADYTCTEQILVWVGGHQEINHLHNIQIGKAQEQNSSRAEQKCENFIGNFLKELSP